MPVYDLMQDTKIRLNAGHENPISLEYTVGLGSGLGLRVGRGKGQGKGQGKGEGEG